MNKDTWIIAVNAGVLQNQTNSIQLSYLKFIIECFMKWNSVWILDTHFVLELTIFVNEIADQPDQIFLQAIHRMTWF